MVTTGEVSLMSGQVMNTEVTLRKGGRVKIQVCRLMLTTGGVLKKGDLDTTEGIPHEK